MESTIWGFKVEGLGLSFSFQKISGFIAEWKRDWNEGSYCIVGDSASASRGIASSIPYERPVKLGIWVGQVGPCSGHMIVCIRAVAWRV